MSAGSAQKRYARAVRTVLPFLFVLPGCSWLTAEAPFEVPAAWSQQVLDGDDYRGISGLATHSGGSLWAVPERQPYLVRIDPDAGAFRERRLLHGVPAGLDTEAVAFSSDGTLFFGTESPDAERTHDVLLQATEAGNELKVTGSLPVPFADLGVSPERNRGVEGVCVTDGWLAASTEVVVTEDGKRWTPIAVRDPAGTAWRLTRLQLTSDAGKVAALDCRLEDGTLVLTAIERHFKVVRVVEARLPVLEASLPERIGATILVDLGEQTRGHLPNFEGLAVTPTKLWLISDNDYGGRISETVLVGIPREP